MRTLVVTDTASADLTQTPPFSPNYTVVAINATATQEVLQSSDAVGGSYATIATIPAGQAVEVVIDLPFLKLVDAGSIILIAN